MDRLWNSLSGIGLLTVLQAVLVGVALLVAPRNRRPSVALAWILLITLLPLIGIVLFALIGSPRLPKVRRAKQQRMDRRIADRTHDLDQVSRTAGAPPWLSSVARLNQNVGAMPLLEGNGARLITTVDDQLAALIDAAARARRYLHVEFFILSYDTTTAPFFTALAAAVRRGVDVRVLLDHLGSRSYPGYRRARRELDRIGARWRLMLPVQPYRRRYQRPDLRNHRKLRVADGEVAFVGSLNMIDPGYQKRANRRRGLRWQDLLAEVHGPVVREVDVLFVTDWYSETDELLPTSAEQTPPAQRQGQMLAQVAQRTRLPHREQPRPVHHPHLPRPTPGQHHQPYFVPDESLLAAITTAARRGVAVELFVGPISDQFLVFHAQHSYYTDLLDAGVRIFEYPGPVILHAKHLSIDEQVAVVGSSNMDIRSFQLDLELTLLVCDRAFTDQMRSVEDGDRRICTQLTADQWNRRTRPHRLIDDLSRRTSAVQ